ncbi:hypothetical protein L204_105692 [Cryptococcus depauperatus]|nr:bis(5'-adenosyl)-triphosphatase [Cryptococcus depauperatus CBS 7855]
MSQRHLFAAFDVSRQVFYSSALSVGIVNLKPLLPGHVLVVPKRIVPRLVDLNSSEVADLFLSVQRIGKVVEAVYEAQALTVSLQDGVAAGQSVPHVHIHLIPRHSTDYNGENDKIYPLLEKSESQLRDDLGNLNASTNGMVAKADNPLAKAEMKFTVPKEEDRTSRTMEEMEREAKWLASFFD